MAKRNGSPKPKRERRTFTEEFKREAEQMVLDDHSAASVSSNLGINNTNLVYRWKADFLASSGPVTQALDSQVIELREELNRTRRERDILPLDLSIQFF